jgi:hypothetical protein
MQALINAMVAAKAQAAAATAAAQAAGVAAGAANSPAAVVVRPVFALYPGDSNAGAFLDFATTDAKKTYRSAIAPIDMKYDLDESKLRLFLEDVGERALIYNWQPILTVSDVNGNDQFILSNYGQVTIEDCIAHATS